jgi:hypothetical protein
MAVTILITFHLFMEIVALNKSHSWCHQEHNDALTRGPNVYKKSTYSNMRNHSALIREFIVHLWSANQRTTEAEEVTDT